MRSATNRACHEAKRKALAARAKHLGDRFARMAREAVSPEASDAWCARIARMVDKAEVAMWGYKDVDGLEYDVLADIVEVYAGWSVKVDGVEVAHDRLDQARHARDQIAETRPELAQRISLELLAAAIDAFAHKRKKKWVALHTLARKSGLRVGKNVDASRVKRLAARRRRSPKL